MPQERKKKQFSVKVYDQKHLRNLSKRLRKVQALIDEAARKGAAIGARTGYKDIEKDFRFDDFPQARREIDALLRELSTALTMNVEEANSEAWGMANAKNDAMVDAMLASTGVDMAKKTTQPWYNKNARALGAFQKRVKDGMNLSTDVWNLGQFKKELELSLEMGLGRGRSAAELSRDVRSFLRYPDKLFRRVRDEKGVLRLSRAAREFHPGQGVYRSSYKNALRLTATENNIAYRSADNLRWKQIDFVVGITISVSKTNHPVVDICDELQGDYPKDFVFTGWHPFCKCFAVPKTASQEEFIKYQQAILDGEDVDGWQFGGEVKDVPKNFKDWVKENEERISRAKSLPYFLKDNPEYSDPVVIKNEKEIRESIPFKGNEPGLPPHIETYKKEADHVYVSQLNHEMELPENVRMAKFLAEKTAEDVFVLPHFQPTSPAAPKLRKKFFPVGVKNGKNPDLYFRGRFVDEKCMHPEDVSDAKRTKRKIQFKLKEAFEQADDAFVEIPTSIPKDWVDGAVKGKLNSSHSNHVVYVKYGDEFMTFESKK